MPKSNRKGYFVNQLRKEGLEQQVLCSQSTQKGIRKQPKIAAKEARERKKIYIQHMQQRIQQLSEEVQTLKQLNHNLNKKCQLLEQQISKQKSQVKEIIKMNDALMEENNSKTARFQGLFKEIASLSINIKCYNKPQVTRNLSVLRDKYGISGRERLKYIDEQFQKIINIMMPMHYRLLMEHSQNNREFYSLLGPQYNNKNLIKLEDREREILLNVRPQVIRQREQYDRIILSLGELKAKIKAQNFKCQGIVDEIQDRVDPIFVGRLLLDLDFCRSKQNLQSIYPINYWNKINEDGFDLVIPPKKIEKQENYNEIKESLFRFQDDVDIINELFM